MTAMAMLAGMVPMALGLGEGGEQNAPLGRAVIGGLMLATVATLFVVPVVYSMLRKNAAETYSTRLKKIDDDANRTSDLNAVRHARRTRSRTRDFWCCCWCWVSRWRRASPTSWCSGKTHDKALASTLTEAATRRAGGERRARARSRRREIDHRSSGQTVALVETPMYARVDGYIEAAAGRHRRPRQEGRPAVEIDTPDLDQQIEQAQATLAQSKATLQQLRPALLAPRRAI